ncbi:hypothetical protein B5F15_07005 [Butyricicoccus pullicaecorum]|uniref:Stage 0 sporulation protein A homolog n=2 Tax=Butyricicoccus pullicaecorum TaxID=501571 RepID=A0A1Y4LSD4_9FIRM|nr:hypothetical protein B5F15_07005 [Butyricicoccus pullicaecorum]
MMIKRVYRLTVRKDTGQPCTFGCRYSGEGGRRMPKRNKRVLLVDDDAMVRIGLKTLVDWSGHGYQLIGEAENGTQALEIARREQPEIVITDMKMPGMDGVALIRALQEIQPPPYVVALSGYDDFLLVREAMKQGAKDYLLKLELTPETLLQSLAGAPDAPNYMPQPDQTMLRSRVLRDLIFHFYLNEDDLEKRLQEAGICWTGETVYCLLLKAGELFRFEEATEEECHTLLFSIRNIAEEIVGACLDAVSTEGKTGELYILGVLRPELAGQDADVLVEQTAHRLHDMLQQYVDVSCTIGIGQGENTAGGMAEACSRASDAMRSRFYRLNDPVIWWQADLCPQIEPETFSTTEARRLLTEGISSLSAETVDEAINLVQKAAARQHWTQRNAYAVAFALAVTVQDCLEACGLDISSQMPRSHGDLLRWMDLHHMGDVRDWLERLRQDLLEYIQKERADGKQAVVRRAQDILTQRFCGEITLPELAEQLDLTPGYLSALMKKYTGKTFSEYLTYLRIEQAKKLLRETNDKIYAVAVAVGYEDAFYFSRIFKRETGMTPGDWRKRAEQRGDAL